MTSNDKTPQPVVNSQLVAQGIALVLSILVALGFITTGESDALADVGVYVIGGIPVVASMIAAFKARGKVTPVATPSDNTGEPLVPTAVLRDERAVAYRQGLTDAAEAAQTAAHDALVAQIADPHTLVTPEQIPAAENALTKEGLDQ